MQFTKAPSVLFSENNSACDPTYLEIRNNPENSALRKRLENMWSRFQAIADQHFLDEFFRPEKFHERFWEMYLGDLILSQHRDTYPSGPKGGPDFKVIVGSMEHYIEAIAPNAGNSEYPSETSFAENIESIILSLSSAFVGKSEKLKQYCKDGLIISSRPRIIAINAHAVPMASREDTDISRNGTELMTKLLFGLGDELKIVSRRGNLVEADYVERREVTKSKVDGSKKSISLGFFENSAYEDISAVMYSSRGTTTIPYSSGDDIVIIHNPFAKNPVTPKTFSFGMERGLKNGHPFEYDHRILAMIGGDGRKYRRLIPGKDYLLS